MRQGQWVNLLFSEVDLHRKNITLSFFLLKVRGQHETSSIIIPVTVFFSWRSAISFFYRSKIPVTSKKKQKTNSICKEMLFLCNSTNQALWLSWTALTVQFITNQQMVQVNIQLLQLTPKKVNKAQERMHSRFRICCFWSLVNLAVISTPMCLTAWYACPPVIPLYNHHVWIPKADSWASILCLLWWFLSYYLRRNVFVTHGEPPCAVVRMIICLQSTIKSMQHGDSFSAVWSSLCTVHFVFFLLYSNFLNFQQLSEVLRWDFSWPGSLTALYLLPLEVQLRLQTVKCLSGEVFNIYGLTAHLRDILYSKPGGKWCNPIVNINKAKNIV